MKKDRNHHHRAVGHVLIGLSGIIFITLVWGAFVAAAILEDEAEALEAAAASALR